MMYGSPFFNSNISNISFYFYILSLSLSLIWYQIAFTNPRVLLFRRPSTRRISSSPVVFFSNLPELLQALFSTSTSSESIKKTRSAAFFQDDRSLFAGPSSDLHVHRRSQSFPAGRPSDLRVPLHCAVHRRSLSSSSLRSLHAVAPRSFGVHHSFTEQQLHRCSSSSSLSRGSIS